MPKDRLPNFLQKHKDFIGVDLGNLEISRLKIVQSSSPELSEFNGALQGEFLHCMTGERLGPTLRICPVYIDSRAILWRPQEAGGGILARADDGKHWTPADAEFDFKLKSGSQVTWRTAPTVRASGLEKRGSYDPSDPASPPAANRMYCIVCAFPDRRDLPPAVAILQGSAIKAATKLIGALKALRAPSFGVVLEMTSMAEKSPSSQGYGYAFEVVGPVEDRGQYEENFLQYRFFIEHGLRVKDLQGAQEEF